MVVLQTMSRAQSNCSEEPQKHRKEGVPVNTAVQYHVLSGRPPVVDDNIRLWRETTDHTTSYRRHLMDSLQNPGQPIRLPAAGPVRILALAKDTLCHLHSCKTLTRDTVWLLFRMRKSLSEACHMK